MLKFALILTSKLQVRILQASEAVTCVNASTL